MNFSILYMLFVDTDFSALCEEYNVEYMCFDVMFKNIKISMSAAVVTAETMPSKSSFGKNWESTSVLTKITDWKLVHG